MNQLLELLNTILPGIWRHRWGALLVAMLLGAAGAVAVMRIPNSYEATSRVYVDTQSILQPLMVGLAIQPNVEQQVGMMARTLINRPNIERVMRMADLDHMAETEQKREALVDHLIREIRFSSAGSTNLYHIAYRSHTPEAARKVVQSLLDIFVESNLGDKRRDREQARRFIDEQIAVYEKRLQDAEEALRDFKIRNLGSMPGAQQDFVSMARDAQAELDQARSELRQAESARDALRREVALEMPASSLPGSLASAEPPRITDTDVRLQNARQRLDELLVQFTDAHPDVVSLRHIIGQLEEQKRKEIEADAARRPTERAPALPVGGDGAYSVIRASLAAAEAQVASLRSRVATAQARVAAATRAAQSIPEVEAELAQLNRDYEINRTNYEQLLARRESAQLAGEMETTAGGAQFRIVDPPRVSPDPVSPNRPILLAGVLVVSLGVGIAYAFLRAQLKPAFFTIKSLRDATELPSLGAVTLVQSAGARWRKRLGVLGFSGATLLYVGVFALAAVYLAMSPSSPIVRLLTGFLK
ncbi:MAG TPA: XrtA system polysaccharide chain length determinant [Thermomicrobiales bacterium]|nr:XrtA system polysaccharide chain length determinant [Thermomicrobiales bacterium]